MKPPYPYSKLSKAPIVEAVVELKVRLTGSVDLTRLGAFRQELSERFPFSRDMQVFQARLNLDPEKGPQQSFEAGTLGVRLESEDKRWVIQARGDGVAISRLAQYDRWESLREQAEVVWPAYVRALEPAAVVRLGVRYINRIELSADTIDFDKVLTKGPTIPNDLPQALTEFYSRIVIPMSDERATLVIVQSFDPAPPIPSGSLPGVVLDIDAFSEEPHEVGSAEIWGTLDRLRQVKNKAFFNSLTADTLESLK